MCYYDNYKFSCQDWKWGNFRQHCYKEYRTGETCGMKMIYQTVQLVEKCPYCEKIEKKLRRIEKARADYTRWNSEPKRYRASMEKALEDIQNLQREVMALQYDKDKRYMQIGNTRRAVAV